MSQLAAIIPLGLLLMVLQPVAPTDNLNPVTIETDGGCPSQEEIDSVVQNLTASFGGIIDSYVEIFSNCGPGRWHRVASLNMSDPSEQCPSAWMEFSGDGIRACGAPDSVIAGCQGIFYSTNRQYSRVCRRVIGYQFGGTDAFGWDAASQSFDSYYVYGVSITHGRPRNHIWTYAAGRSEGAKSLQSINCPCSKPNDPGNALVPQYVGDNYYCESGNPAGTFIERHLYSDDPLWDGQQCEGECCSNGKSPPWFSVELPNPTTDDIEVRICGAQPDDSPIQLLEIYIL